MSRAMPQILLVMSDGASRAEVVAWLQEGGYRLKAVATGHAAMAEAVAERCDLIVIILPLPDIEGVQLLNAVRSRFATLLLPVLFVTPVSEIASAEAYGAEKQEDCLAGPLARAELLEAVALRLAQRADRHHGGAFAGVAAPALHHTLPHELRSPLSGILGFAELLKEAETLGAEELREMALLLLDGGQRLQRLLENYLLLAQLDLLSADDARMQRLRAARFGGATAAVAHVAQHVAVMHGRHDDLQLFLTEYEAELAIAEADWEKIVREVVDNAFRYSTPGSAVMVGTGLGEGAYMLSVQDHGCGMPAARVKEIASAAPFTARVYEQQGGGLGLALARGLAGACGGSLHIQSRPDSGTRVYVRLPLPSGPI